MTQKLKHYCLYMSSIKRFAGFLGRDEHQGGFGSCGACGSSSVVVSVVMIALVDGWGCRVVSGVFCCAGLALQTLAKCPTLLHK